MNAGLAGLAAANRISVTSAPTLQPDGLPAALDGRQP